MSRSQIREVALVSGRHRDLTNDLSGYGSITLSRDANALAAVKKDARSTVWVSNPSDLLHGQSTLVEVQNSSTLAWMGDDLLINSRRTGNLNLGLLHPQGGTETVLTNAPYVEQNAAPVPGRASVVLSSNRGDGFHIWRFDSDTNRYSQLTFGNTYDDTPAVLPDSSAVLYTEWLGNTCKLRKVSISGGPSAQVLDVQAADPQISPDGKWIACRVKSEEGALVLAIVPSDGSGAPRILENAHLPFRWSPGGKSLTVSITSAAGVSNLWEMRPGEARLRQLTRFDDDQTISSFAWSKNRRLACIRMARNADVVLFSRAVRR